MKFPKGSGHNEQSSCENGKLPMWETLQFTVYFIESNEYIHLNISKTMNLESKLVT